MNTLIWSLVVLISALELLDGFSYASSSSNINRISRSSAQSRSGLSLLSRTSTSLASLSQKSTHGIGSYIVAGLGQSSSGSLTITSSEVFSRNSSSLLSSPTQNSTSLSPTYTANATQISSNGTGSAYAQSCSKALESYDAARASWQSSHKYETYETIGFSVETTTVYQYVTTTLCDGIPRAISPHDPDVQTSTISGYYGEAVATSPYPVKPPCSIAPVDCDPLMATYYSESVSYTSALSAWSNYSEAHESSVTCSESGGYHSCSIPGAPISPTSPPAPDCVPSSVCSACQITAQSIRLLYWPQTAVPNNGLCPNGTNMTTYTAEPTGSGPNTQVFEGMTLTSPTAYMSFSGVGVDWCGTQSIVKTNTIIPVDPHDVSSLRVVPYPIAGEPYPYGTFAGPYSFNYGDFNTPMPYSAYTNAWFCHGEPANFCPIMTPDQYSPIVAYPKSFMEILNPMYSACTLIYDYRGVYDPPHALQQEPSAARPIPVSPTTPPARGPSPIPTGPNMNPTTPASASPPIIAPTPSRTPNQQPTPNPTEPSAAGPLPSYPQPPGQGGSGDPAGNDPRPAQDPNPPPAQPAQDPPPGNPPSDPDSDPRPAPGPAGNDNGNVNGDPGTPSSGNTPRPEGGSSEGDPARGGDPAQAAGGNIVSMLLSPGGRGGGGGGGSSGANAGADSDPSNGGAPENSGYGYGSSSGSDSPSDPGIDILPALAEGGSNPRPSPGDFAPGQGASSGGGGGSAGGDAGAQDPRVVAQVGGQPVYAIPNEPNAVQIAGATLRPGSQTEMGGTPVSVGNGYLVVASGAQASTVALGGSGVAQDLRVVGKVGGLLVYAVPNDPDGVQIDGTTLRAGTMTEIGGAPVSVGNGYVVVGSGAAASTISLPGTTAGANARLGLGGDNGAGNAIVQAAAGTGAVLTLGSQTLTALDEPGHSGIVVIGSQTLSLGGPLATIDGHVMSVGSNGLVIDGSSTVALATPLTADSGSGTKATAVVSLGSDVVTASEESNGDMVIGTQTLSVGGPALTIDGHVFSDGPNGVVIDGSRTASWAPFSGIAEEEVRVTGADGKVLTAVEESGHPGTVVMDGSITLSVGGPAITVDGEVVSLAPGGLVVNGSVTKAFSNAPITASATNTAANSATGAATRFGNAQATSTKSGAMALRIRALVVGLTSAIWFFAFLV